MLLFVDIHISHSQHSSQWSAITSYNTVNSITQSSDGVIWGVSNGGLFSFDNGDFDKRLTSVDGMYRLDGRVISYLEDFNSLLIGYIDGMIDLYNLETGSFERIEDIRRVQSFSARAINSILYDSGAVYVATDFGVVVYNPNTFLVSSSYTKIGDFDSGTPVIDIDIRDGMIMLSTQQGIAVASLTSNLNIESSWTTYSQSDGLPIETVQSLIFFNGELHASTISENLVHRKGEWVSNDVLTGYTQVKYKDITESGLLIAYNHNRILRVTSDNELRINIPGLEGMSDIIYDEEINSQVYVSSIVTGIGIGPLNSNTFEYVSPEGPNLNFFEGMSFDGNVFISGTTRLSQRSELMDNPKGYYIFDGDEWRNYNRINNAVLNQNRFRQAFTSTYTDEYYYIGSWGRGIARHDRETDEIVVSNASNSSLRGWAADSDTFPVISGLERDTEGRVWATSRFATNPLYVQQPGEDDWIMYSKSSVVGGTDEYLGLFIDSFDQKWITLQSTGRSGRGLLILDTGETENVDESFGVKLTDEINNGNLPDLQVTDIIEDRDGEIWVGTERGIARYIFPQFIINGSQEERRGQWLLNKDPEAESPFLLRDINVTSMAVNSANQKWIGTANEGVWLLNETGSAILKHYTTNNSPLFSNTIREIAIFEETGEVYISTELGLSIYRDTPITPVQSMDNLKVYPNPFLYDRHNTISIENLSETTTIRILGVNGTLITTLESRGGRAEWNGLDYSGEQVGSGVYIVVALGSDGNQRGVGKVAIIR